MAYISSDIREQVILRANNCCEYCLLSQEDYPFSFHIEHIIAEKHGGQTRLDNLALSCPTCNRYKGTNIAGADPETGEATFLYHPRHHEWEDHFILDSPIITPLTPEGRVTVHLLRQNDSARIRDRDILFKLSRYPCSTK